MTALEFTPRRGDRSTNYTTCSFCLARSGRHRVEIMGLPTGTTGQHEHCCDRCKIVLRRAWDEALDAPMGMAA